jgi:hypothetical protein
VGEVSKGLSVWRFTYFGGLAATLRVSVVAERLEDALREFRAQHPGNELISVMYEGRAYVARAA